MNIEPDPLQDGADKGIIPLTCAELFRQCDERHERDSDVSFVVEVSYIEVSEHLKPHLNWR